MKQCVSLLDTSGSDGSGNSPSERHRSDMLLDLSGLTREERVLLQASINNERFLQCLNLCFLTVQLSLLVNYLA